MSYYSYKGLICAQVFGLLRRPGGAIFQDKHRTTRVPTNSPHTHTNIHHRSVSQRATVNAKEATNQTQQATTPLPPPPPPRTHRTKNHSHTSRGGGAKLFRSLRAKHRNSALSTAGLDYVYVCIITLLRRTSGQIWPPTASPSRLSISVVVFFFW